MYLNFPNIKTRNSMRKSTIGNSEKQNSSYKNTDHS